MLINTDISHKASAEEKKKVFLFCLKNYKQLTTGADSSWVIFENTDGYTLSIAKPDTGAESSRFGDKFHFIQTYKNRLEELTAEGMKLIGEVKKMIRYRIAKDQSLIAGEDIRLEKITTAERIGNAALKSLYFFIATVFIFNLIRFIF